MSSKDLVHKQHGKWYFWEEDAPGRQGPFGSRREARRKLKEYQ